MTNIKEILTPYVDPTWHYGLAVSIGEGWEQLVLDAHAKLVEIDPDYRISQVKEKFGGLRYYVSLSNREMWKQAEQIIRAAEAESLRTCEECGTEEEVETNSLGDGYHWIFTLCGECRAKRLADRQARDAKYASEDM